MITTDVQARVHDLLTPEKVRAWLELQWWQAEFEPDIQQDNVLARMLSDVLGCDLVEVDGTRAVLCDGSDPCAVVDLPPWAQRYHDECRECGTIWTSNALAILETVCAPAEEPPAPQDEEREDRITLKLYGDDRIKLWANEYNDVHLFDLDMGETVILDARMLLEAATYLALRLTDGHRNALIERLAQQRADDALGVEAGPAPDTHHRRLLREAARALDGALTSGTTHEVVVAAQELSETVHSYLDMAEG